jgi:NAD(P)-dependent dehydrogenase (short-subunit alcohol dehydrogenase family)
MDILFSLKNKNILITGASSGIGKKCAEVFAESGANLILIARNTERLTELKRKLPGNNHLIYSLDLGEYDKIEPCIEDAVTKIGRINGFVHSAGFEITKPVKNMLISDYEKLFMINTITAFEITRILSKKKNVPEEGASYVFIAALIGLIGRPALIGYGASKGALISGMKTIALELANKKIRANCISPGFVQTDMMEKLQTILSEDEINKLKMDYPLGLGHPEDIAYAAVYLLSDESRWMTGNNLIVDGGFLSK